MTKTEEMEEYYQKFSEPDYVTAFSTDPLTAGIGGFVWVGKDNSYKQAAACVKAEKVGLFRYDVLHDFPRLGRFERVKTVHTQRTAQAECARFLNNIAYIVASDLGVPIISIEAALER